MRRRALSTVRWGQLAQFEDRRRFGIGHFLAEPPFDVNQINTKTVSAIEFYAGSAQIPAEYNVTQGTCGALVIWTK